MNKEMTNIIKQMKKQFAKKIFNKNPNIITKGKNSDPRYLRRSPC